MRGLIWGLPTKGSELDPPATSSGASGASGSRLARPGRRVGGGGAWRVLTLLLLLACLPLGAHSLPWEQPARPTRPKRTHPAHAKPSAALLQPAEDLQLAFSPPAPVEGRRPPGMLDPLGRLMGHLPTALIQQWRGRLHNPRLARLDACRLHLLLGEWELGHNEQPERALSHFETAERLAPLHSQEQGLAAYDRCLALYNEGAYAQSAQAFLHLLKSHTYRAGFDRHNAALWQRHAAVCAGYHAERARMGIPEPPKLDPLCGAAALAACLREQHLPYSKQLVLSHMHVTGKGSSLQDILVAARKLGVSAFAFHTDDAGLRALKSGCVAYVEHDHFIYVVKAGQHGVSYLCSDCGPFPGGQVNLTWKQWHALEPTAYAVIAKSGSDKERQLRIALSGSEKAQGEIKHKREQALIQAHPQLASLILHLVALQEPIVGTVCGYTNQSLQCPCYQSCPTDGGGGATKDPVELATGEECYTPDPDISAYNPEGQSAVFARRCDSLRGWDPAYNSDDFGLGWSHNFQGGVYMPQISPCPLVNGQGSISLPVTFFDPAQQGTWDIVCQDNIIASSVNPNGWQVVYNGANNIITVVIGPGAVAWAGYEVRVGANLSSCYAATFAIVNPDTVPRGLGSFALPALSGTDLPADQTPGTWDITYQGTVIATRKHPKGWYVSATANGSNTTYSVAAPVGATLSNAYEFRYKPQLQQGCRIEAGRRRSARRRQTITYTSTPFTVVDSRLYPMNAGIGSNLYHSEIVEPGGGHIQAYFLSMPSALNPQVQGQVLSGVPAIVYWNFDPHNPLGNYTVEFSDRTTWVVGDCNKVVINTTTGAWIPRVGGPFEAPRPSATIVFGASFPLVQKIDRNNNALHLRYGALTDSGFPMLTSITDGFSVPLLTLNHAADGTGSLLSVSDRYGRSVYYHETTYSTAENGPFDQPPYILVDKVSQVVPTRTNNPPARVSYGYTNVANEITFNGETVPMLTSISVPSPTGTGTSTATITYAADTEFVTQIRDANGYTHSYQFTSTPPPDPAARLLGLSWVNQNQVTIADNTGKTVATYTVYFDSAMREITRTDANGNFVRAMLYNNVGDPFRPSSIMDGKYYLGNANGTIWNFTYDMYGHVLTAISPYGVTTTYTYDYTNWFTGELVKIQQGNRTPTTFTYNEPSGLPATVTFAAPGTVNKAATVTYNTTWDAMGNLTSITTPGNNATIVNGVDQGATTTFNYTQDGSYSQTEALGQPIAVTDNLGKVTHFRYYNNATNPTDPLANTGQIKSIVDPSGHESDFTYNLTGQTVKITFPVTGETGSGQANTQFSYLFPGGPITNTAHYDESGNKVRSVSPVYGKEGEVLSATGNVLAVTAVYDALYRLVSLTDGKQNATTYLYSGDHLTTIKYPNGTTYQATQWDVDDNVTAMTDPNQVSYSLTYNDPEGRLTNVTTFGPHPVSSTYTYDNYGRVATYSEGGQARTYTYDDDDAVKTLTNQFQGMTVSQQIAPSFYPSGSLQSLSTPAGLFSYSYNQRGELTGLTNPAGDAFSWSYQDSGRLQSKQVGNAAQTAYSYNAVGQLLEQKTTLLNGGSTLADLTFASSGGYDGAGDLLGLTTSLPLSPGAYSGTSSYTYDALSQLTRESSTRQGNFTNNFVYDAVGNPTTFRSQAGLTYNGLNQSLNGTQYDNDGNPQSWQTQALTFDDENQLIAFGSQFQYGYSGGDRIWKQTPAGKTYFLNLGGAPICELDSNGNVLATNSFGADGLCARTSAGSSTFYNFDVQGGTLLRLSSSGGVLGSYNYDAYGNRISTENSSDPYAGYGAQSGYYRDAETGLSLLGARYYDSSQGRFLTRDPIGYEGGINLYGYAANNPISNIDPSGLKPCWMDDDGSPAFDNCYQNDLQAGDHPGIKWAKGCIDYWAHWIPFYPLIPAFTGHDMWGCSLTPLQRVMEGAAGTAPLWMPHVIGAAGNALGAAADALGDALAGEEGELASGNCFVAGTPVPVVDASALNASMVGFKPVSDTASLPALLKPIEQVKPNDLVVTRDPQTGNTEYRRVQWTKVRHTDAVLTLTLADQSTGATVEEITVTPEHPFYVADHGFVPAGRLAIGNSIVTRAGPPLLVKQIAWQTSRKGYTVYNFEVEDTHTYFVGIADGGVWVHNYDYDQHHLFPQELRSNFETPQLGLDIDDWTIKIPRDFHRQWLHGGIGVNGYWVQNGGNPGGWWNLQWRNFFAANPNAGIWDVMNQLKWMTDYWGLSGYTIRRYWSTP